MSPSYWFKIIFSVALIIALQCRLCIGAEMDTPQSRRDSVTGVQADGQSTDFRMKFASSVKSVEDFLNSPEGQVINEDTPVWTVSRPNLSFGPTYVKLEKNKVKKTIDDWRSSGSKSIFNRARSSGGSTVRNLFSSMGDGLSSLVHRIHGDVANDSISRSRSVERLSLEPMQTHYLSTLLVLTYDDTWPTDAEKAEKLINERLLYGTAFWTDVNFQLRHIKPPRVNLKISAVVIAKDRNAIPYVSDNYNTFDGMHMADAFDEMLDYWREVPKQNIGDFPTSGYHVVITMTDLVSKRPGHPRAKGSPAVDCDDPKADIYGLIFSDDLVFNGLQTAVRGIGHILGAVVRDDNSNQATPPLCPTRKGDVMIRGIDSIGREWAPCSLEEISLHLKYHGQCLQTPREIQPSGQPIVGFLPGDVMNPAAQCIAHTGRGKICSQNTSCEKLSCRSTFGRCSDVGPILDGVGQNAGKKCVDHVAVH